MAAKGYFSEALKLNATSPKGTERAGPKKELNFGGGNRDGSCSFTDGKRVKLGILSGGIPSFGLVTQRSRGRMGISKTYA